MEFMDYVIENALILIPVLYILGAFLKGLENIKDKYIPLVLLAIGIGFSVAIIGFSVDAIIQGILVTGVRVLGNQLIKQYKNKINRGNLC